MEELITIEFTRSELNCIYSNIYEVSDECDFEYQPEEFQEKIKNILKKIEKKNE